MNSIDGSRWSSSGIFSKDSKHCRFSPRSRTWWLKIQCELEQFPGRIIFMSMYNDIVWRERKNGKLHIANSPILADYARRFSHGHWLVVSWAWIRKKWNGIHTYKPYRKWHRDAEDMMLNLSESAHSVFRGSSALERGNLKNKGKGKLSFHFCGDDKSVEAVLRTIISVNQLSI